MKTMKHIAALFLALCCLAAAPGVHARSVKDQVLQRIESAMEPGATQVPATGQVEFAFSPRGGAEGLILKVIGTSQRDVRMMAYALTNPKVVAALIDAHKSRRVNVEVLVDWKQNVREDRSGKAKAAMGALVNAGIQVRTVDSFAIHHDKVLLVDGVHLQTGSFNYSAAAANSNSENVIVLWNNPAAVQGYMKHWTRNWSQGRPWQPAY